MTCSVLRPCSLAVRLIGIIKEAEKHQNLFDQSLRDHNTSLVIYAFKGGHTTQWTYAHMHAHTYAFTQPHMYISIRIRTLTHTCACTHTHTFITTAMTSQCTASYINHFLLLSPLPAISVSQIPAKEVNLGILATSYFERITGLQWNFITKRSWTFNFNDGCVNSSWCR